MNEHQFKRLLEKYQQGNLPDKDRALVEQWLNSLQASEQAVWTDAEMKAQAARLLARIRSSKPADHRVLPLTVWLKAAAAIMLLAVASFTVWQWQAVEMVNVTTLAETQKVILPDGSIIWLKANSTLTYPDRFKGDTRNISFSGEALFEIAKDKDHPFIIESGAHTATVLGTSFRLAARSETLELTVLTGKVALSSDNAPHEVVVLPNEKVTYTGKVNAVKETASVQEVEQITAGTEYSMKFTDHEVREVLARIEGKFNVTVDTDHLTDTCRITGDLTDKSIEETLNTMAVLLDLEYEQKRNTIYIRGGSCK